MFTDLYTAENGFVLFCIFVGAGYQLFVRKNTEGLATYARVYSQFSAVVLIGAISILLLTVSKWNPILVGIIGFLACQGGARFIWLTAEFFDKQVDIIKLIETVGNAFLNFYNTFKSGTPKDSLPKDPTAP